MNHKTRDVPTLQALIKYIGVECDVGKGVVKLIGFTQRQSTENHQSYDLTKNNKTPRLA